jgi:hypothetical protein
MSVPADDTDDSDFCERVVIKFCAKRKRHLDSPDYNDEPNQKPKKHVLGPRANGKLTAAQNKCHPSSFTKAPITKKLLPPPDSQEVPHTTSAYLRAIIKDSAGRAEIHRNEVQAAASRRLEAATAAEAEKAIREEAE